MKHVRCLQFGAIAVLLGSLALPASAGIIFQDDFNDGNSNGWTSSGVQPWWSDPATSVIDGKFNFANLGASLADSLNGQEDLDITVDVPLVGQSQALVLRYKDGNNLDIAWYNKTFEQLYFFQVTGGGWDFVGRIQANELVTGPVSLRAQVVGANVTFSVTDGTNTVSTSQVLPPVLLGPGKWGLFATTETGPVQFDNYVASTVPEPSSLLALAGGLIGILGVIRRRQ